MRNKVIDEATELIKGNKIDFSCFLKRVTFDKNKVCAEMMAFERVDPIDETDIFNQLDYEHETTEDLDNNSELPKTPLCVVCKSALPTVTLLPCRHQCVCLDCCHKWNRVDRTAFDVLPIVDNYNDVEIFNRQNSHTPYQDMVCPVCKSAVKTFFESILS